RSVDVLAARIDQVELTFFELAVGLLARLVMDDRAVRPGARNAVEREVAKLAIFPAQRFQMVGRLELVDVALGRLLVDPAQEARDDRPVAGLGGLLAGDLGGILERLRED